MITVKDVTVKRYLVELTQEQAEGLAGLLGSGINADVLNDLGLFDLHTELNEQLGVFSLQNKGGNVCRWRHDIPIKALPMYNGE